MFLICVNRPYPSFLWFIITNWGVFFFFFPSKDFLKFEVNMTPNLLQAFG